MAEESGGEPRREAGCGIGARLRDARERAGLTVVQAAQRLHVAVEVIDALEAEEFDALGAPIYVKSYLGRYAELLGESPEALKERLTAAVVIPEPDLTRIPHATVEDRGYITVIVIVVAVVLALLLAWWAWTRWHRFAEPMSLVRMAVPQHVARIATPPVVHTRALAAARPAATAGVPARSAHVPSSAASVHLTLQFPASSWVAVTDATGRKLYRGMVAAGVTQSFEGTGPIHVLLGYASGVTLKVDGRAVPISAYVERDHAASIEVTAGGRVSPAPSSSGE